MIFYVTTRSHRYTMSLYLDGLGHAVKDRIRIVAYEQLRGHLPPGAYVFADLERLKPWWREFASRVHDRLVAGGRRVLNDPARSLCRYDLQSRLRDRQDFRVFRAAEVPADLRYPVFLRGEMDHDGPATDLIENGRELAAALREHPGSLVVEQLHTADYDGVFRKYSAFRVGDAIFPRHLFFSRDWVVKHADLADERLIREELDYFERNPHAVELREIFDLADIDYGRIDYALKDDRIQVWEINTNPNIATDVSTLIPLRNPVNERFIERMNHVLTELDDDSPTDGPPVRAPLNLPRLLWRSRSGR